MVTLTPDVISLEMSCGGSGPEMAGIKVHNRDTSERTSITLRGFETSSSILMGSEERNTDIFHNLAV